MVRLMRRPGLRLTVLAVGKVDADGTTLDASRVRSRTAS